MLVIRMTKIIWQVIHLDVLRAFQTIKKDY